MITKSSQAYVVRGIGLINDLEELRNIVVKNINGTPILVKIWPMYANHVYPVWARWGVWMKMM